VELVDTSVWARQRHSELHAWFADQLGQGQIALCDMVALEILHTAATAERYLALESHLRLAPWLRMDRWEWTRALEVYGLLAAQGDQRHRSVKHADLLISACAERHSVTLVHYDRDFDTIAAVTGQSARWVAPRGSLES
jgi:predicted nucleic acid-binding protein